MTLLTVSIATENRIQYLQKLVMSLDMQDFDREKVAIQIIVDGDFSGEIELVQNIRNNLNIAVFRQPKAGLSAARNLGISLCRSPFIRFQDDDDTLSLGSINELLRLHQKFPNDVFVNETYARDKNSLLMHHAIEVEGWLFNNKLLRNDNLDFSSVWGGRFSAPLRYFEGIKFDENLTFGAEDIVWASQARSVFNFNIQLIGNVISTMERSLNEEDLCLRSFNQGFSYGYVEKNFPHTNLEDWARKNCGLFAHNYDLSEVIREFHFTRNCFFSNLGSLTVVNSQKHLDKKIIELIYARWWRLLGLSKAIGYHSFIMGLNRIESQRKYLFNDK